MQITPSVHALHHRFNIPVKPGEELERSVFSFVLFGSSITLIDTGVAGCEKDIYHLIRSCGREPSEITDIILTHSHPDHIGAASLIQKATRCSVAAHYAEQAWIEDVNRQNRERPVPGFSALVSGSVKINRFLKDKDRIIGHGDHGGDLHVVHTPGHSPGSISLFLESDGLLFSGDAIVVIGDFPVYDDLLAFVDSIRRLRQIQGIQTLLQAWNVPISGNEIYRAMDTALCYVKDIHAAVREGHDEGISDLMELTRRTASVLGLPPQAVNPLFARSIAAHFRILSGSSLLGMEQDI